MATPDISISSTLQKETATAVDVEAEVSYCCFASSISPRSYPFIIERAGEDIKWLDNIKFVVPICQKKYLQVLVQVLYVARALSQVDIERCYVQTKSEEEEQVSVSLSTIISLCEVISLTNTISLFVKLARQRSKHRSGITQVFRYILFYIFVV